MSAREKEIVQRMAAGQKRAAIAADLALHVKTVDFHLRKVRRRLGVGSLIEVAVHFARLKDFPAAA